MARESLKIVATSKAEWKSIRSEAGVAKNLFWGKSSVGKYLQAFQTAFSGTEGLRKSVTNEPDLTQVRFTKASADKIQAVVKALDKLTGALKTMNGRLASEKKDADKEIKALRDSAAKSGSKKAELEKKAKDLEEQFELFETTVKEMVAEATKKFPNWQNAAKDIDALVEISTAVDEGAAGALQSIQEAMPRIRNIFWETGSAKELELEFLEPVGIINSAVHVSHGIRRDAKDCATLAAFGDRMYELGGEAKKLISDSHKLIKLTEARVKEEPEQIQEQERKKINGEVNANIDQALACLQQMLQGYSAFVSRPSR